WALRSRRDRLRQFFLQHLERGAHPGLHRTERLVQPLRHFTLRETLKVGQFDRQSLLRSEFLERRFQPPCPVERKSVVFEVGEQGWILKPVQFQASRSHAPFHGSKMIDSPVTRHRENPWAQGATLIVERLRPVPHPKKSFLHQILGRGGIAHHTIY